MAKTQTVDEPKGEKVNLSKDEIDKLLRRGRKSWKLSQTAEGENRQTALSSIRFTDGDQWPEHIKNEREAEKRPFLTNNLLRKFVKQMAGDIRQNLPSIKVTPNDDDADVAGAEVRQDLIRNIEQKSDASSIYAQGGEQSLDGGFGYWRIVTEWAPDDFKQDIRIKPIPNRFTVYLDQTSQMYTYEDGKFAFITEVISTEEYEERYPNEEASSFESLLSQGEQYEGWFLEGKIRLAEYYYKEPITIEIAQLSDGSIIELKKGVTPESLAQEGLSMVRTRKASSHRIMWCLMAGHKILEGPVRIPGEYIPIVPVLGNEVNLEGRRLFRSLIHDAMDPQRMANYWDTHATETVALAPKAPFKLTPEQIDGHEEQWANANTKNMPYLLYNFIPGAPTPQRERPPDIPTAALTMSERAQGKIDDTIGRYEASQGRTSNERSGKAIRERKQASDTTTFTFVDNLTKSVVHTGKVILSMLPEVYDTERIIRLRGEDGKESILRLNTAILDPETLETVMVNDLSIGKYDINVEVGPMYHTKRAETAASMAEFLQFAPDSAPIIGPRMAKAQDWPGAQEIAEEFKQLYAPPPEEGAQPPQ